MAAQDDDQGEVAYTIQYKGEDKVHNVLTKNGWARATFVNGDVFEGEYNHGKRNGRGVYTFKRGGSYDGSYVDNKKDGEGTLTAPDGSKYVGQWKNDKRNGTGTYYYANGDRYIGGWRNGAKHGAGTYLYAHVQCQLSAEWSNGQCQNGVWTTHDGTKYTGTFLSNTPNGPGVFRFANGNAETGRFEVKLVPVNDDGAGGGDDEEKKLVFQWSKDNHERILPDTAPPKVVADPDPLRRAGRAIDKAVLKLDHFESIYRLEKRFDGVPNFRKIDASTGAATNIPLPIYGSGQPSVTGFQLVINEILNGGASAAAGGAEPEEINKIVWVNMRQEPVIYVNNMSYAPRDLKALNENMEFPGVDSKMITTLEQRMAEALRKKTFAAGNIHTYYKDTFAENPADRKNLVLTEDVAQPLDTSIRPIGAVYSSLVEAGTEVVYVRLPIVDERSPSLADFDHLVEVLKTCDEKTAMYFNCQMGKGRTTTGMVCAVLIKRVLDPNNKEPEPADYNDASPDYALGQYKVIMKLVEALSKGTPDQAAAAAAAAAAATATANGAAASAVDVKSAPAAAPAAGDEKAAPADAGAAAAVPVASATPAGIVITPAVTAAGANGTAAAAAVAAAGDAGIVPAANKENGEFVKADVDDAIDKCRAMQHLRTCIIEARDKANKESSLDRKLFWKEMSRNFLERYFFLILFNAYLRDAGRPKRPEKKKKKPAAAPVAAAPAGDDKKSADAEDADDAADGKSKKKAASKSKKAAADDDEDDDEDEEAKAARLAEDEDAKAEAEAKRVQDEADRKAAEEEEAAEEEAREAERWEEIKANFQPFSSCTFSKWVAERPHLLAILGTRQSGAMVKRVNAIQIGRVCLINRGPDNGKICTIIDIVDQNRALVDGPADVTGISRQTLSFRALALTPIVVEIARNPRPKTLRAAVTKQNVVAQWETSNWAAKLKAQRVKQSLSDFDRFRNMVAHKKRANIVGREFAKLKRAPQPKKKVKKSVVKKAEIARKEAEAKKKELEKARAEEKKRIEKDKADKANAKGKDGKKTGDEPAAAKKKK